MQVTLFMAISADGFIAKENGSEDFLSHENWNCFCRSLKKYKNLIWGRKTYEAVKKWGGNYFKSLKGIEKIIISNNKSFRPEAGWTLAASPAAALRVLAKKGFKSALLSGGSKLNSAFARAKLLDRVMLNVEPIIIGRGIALFDPSRFNLRLKLLSARTLKRGILTLEYKVL